MKIASIIVVLLIIVGLGWSFFYTKNRSLPAPTNTETMDTFTLTSLVFENQKPIPSLYTCEGKNISPPLSIKGVPAEVKSLALVMDDPDVPKQLLPAGVFDHWLVYGISPQTTEIAEGTSPGAQGLNSRGVAAYTGPCPPTEYQPTTHRYFFRLYALDTELNFVKAPTKEELLAAIKEHTLAVAELMGTYDKTKK